jgi:hypothetical protein
MFGSSIKGTRSGYWLRYQVAVAAIVTFWAGTADAQFGPNASAVIVPHMQPGLEYSQGQTYEHQSNLRNAEDAIVSAQVLTGEDAPVRIFYAMLCLDNCSPPYEVGGVQFGFGDYSEADIRIDAHGICNDNYLIIPTSGWPGPNEGLALLFVPAKETKIIELAWFAVFAYTAATLPLGPADLGGGPWAGVSNRTNPPISDELEESQLGVLGFGVEGYNPLGPPDRPGACCVAGRCQLVRRADCDLQGGKFTGENTPCFPNPCLPPRPSTWGRLKVLFE